MKAFESQYKYLIDFFVLALDWVTVSMLHGTTNYIFYGMEHLNYVFENRTMVCTDSFVFMKRAKKKVY